MLNEDDDGTKNEKELRQTWGGVESMRDRRESSFTPYDSEEGRRTETIVEKKRGRTRGFVYALPFEEKRDEKYRRNVYEKKK